MKRFDPQLWLGMMLVLGGVLVFFDTMGVISNAGDSFWGLIWGAGALVFFFYMLMNGADNGWAAFPAFTLLGLAAQSFLPESLSQFDGLAFFAGTSLAFWWVYFGDRRERRWAIIPAGILLALGAFSFLGEVASFGSGGQVFPPIATPFTCTIP